MKYGHPVVHNFVRNVRCAVSRGFVCSIAMRLSNRTGNARNPGGGNA
jgi:hypothetical protein